MKKEKKNLPPTRCYARGARGRAREIAAARGPQIRSRAAAAPPGRAGKDAAETAAETNPTAGSTDRITCDLIPLRCGLTMVFPLVMVYDVD